MLLIMVLPQVGGETPRILPWVHRGRLCSNTDPGVMGKPDIRAWFWRWLAFRVVMGQLK